MKKLLLVAFVLGMIIPTYAHHQKTQVRLSLWNFERFNITVDGYTFHNVYDFEDYLRPGRHFVKIWIHERTHRGGHVQVLHKGYIHVNGNRRLNGTVTRHGAIRWEQNCDRPGREYGRRSFSDLYYNMDRAYQDHVRLQIALDFTAGMRLTAFEMEAILTRLRLDRYRYEFARTRYNQCTDPQYFYRCANTIRNYNQRRELMAWASGENNQGRRRGRR